MIDLKDGLTENAKKVELNVQPLAKLKEKQDEWKQPQEEDMALAEGKMLSLAKTFEDTANTRVDSVDFKKIVEEQLNEKKLAEK